MYLEALFGLKGKVALVTGAGRGIGQAVALGLAKAGAEIVIFELQPPDETIQMIQAAGGKAYGLLVDVTDGAAVEAAMQTILERSGRLDIVFNNAGICVHTPSLEDKLEDFRRVVDVNLTGEYIIAQAAARLMVAHSIKGSIINMASMSASIVNIPQWQASYNASKAGVVHLTRSLAVEWAAYGIRVNSLSPGYIATAMTGETPQAMRDAWLSLIPGHRMGTPEELVGAVIYLAADSSSYTSGCDLIVDGAYTCF